MVRDPRFIVQMIPKNCATYGSIQTLCFSRDSYIFKCPSFASHVSPPLRWFVVYPSRLLPSQWTQLDATSQLIAEQEQDLLEGGALQLEGGYPSMKYTYIMFYLHKAHSERSYKST